MQGTLLGEDGGHRVGNEAQVNDAQRGVQLLTRSAVLAYKQGSVHSHSQLCTLTISSSQPPGRRKRVLGHRMAAAPSTHGCKARTSA